MGVGRGERPASRRGGPAVYAAGLSAAGLTAVRVGRARVYARLCGVGRQPVEAGADLPGLGAAEDPGAMDDPEGILAVDAPGPPPDPVERCAADLPATTYAGSPRRTPVALAVLSVVGAAACSSSPSSSASSGPTGGPTGTPACTASQLHVDVKPLPGAATGRTFMDVVLTDKSASPCTLTGSVKLTVADAAHHRIPVPSTVFPGSGATTVTVHPGGSAAEAVAYDSDGNPAPGQTVCAPPVAFYDITAPGATTAVSVPIAGRQVLGETGR